MRRIVYIILVFVAIFVVSLCIWNGFNNKAFWTFNIFNGLTMLWTIGFSFIISQTFSHYQRQSDIMIKLITNLSSILDESKTCQINESEDKEILLMQNRQISTQISYLKQHAQKFGIKKEVEFVSERFKEYESFIGDHIDDMSYLSKSRTELSRPIKLISTKLYDIMLKL